VAKWNATVHAATSLSLYNPGFSTFVDFLPIENSNLDGSALGNFALGNF
jgi:hypothetical protein